jgi:serine protease Do
MYDNYENGPDRPEDENINRKWGDFYKPKNKKSEDYNETNNNFYSSQYGGDFNPFGTPPQQPKKEPNGTKLFLGIIISLLATVVIGFSLYGVYMSYSNTPDKSAQTSEKSAEQEESSESSKGPELTIIDNSENESAMSGQDIYKKCAPSIVRIDCFSQDSELFSSEVGMGSGIIISKDGYIVTNAHVVTDKNGNQLDITVSLGENDERKAKIIGVDQKTDLALVKMEAKNLTPAELGNSDQAQIGESAFIIGNPLALEKSMTKGIISGLDRSISNSNAIGSLVKYIQTDAALNPGNSGGGLFNAKGKVIGIIGSKFTNQAVDNMGFAIPMKTVKEVIDDLIAFGHVKGRPALGITVKNITPYMAQTNNIPMGAYIHSFNDNCTLPANGVREKDIITKVNGKDTDTVNALHATLREYKVGDSVTLTIFRRASQMSGQERNTTFEVQATLVEESK